MNSTIKVLINTYKSTIFTPHSLSRLSSQTNTSTSLEEEDSILTKKEKERQTAAHQTRNHWGSQLAAPNASLLRVTWGWGEVTWAITRTPYLPLAREICLSRAIGYYCLEWLHLLRNVKGKTSLLSVIKIPWTLWRKIRAVESLHCGDFIFERTHWKDLEFKQKILIWGFYLCGCLFGRNVSHFINLSFV